MDKLVEKIDKFLEKTTRLDIPDDNVAKKKQVKKITKNKTKKDSSDTEDESDVELDLSVIVTDDPNSTTKAIDVWHKCQELKINVKQKELYEHLGKLYGKQQKVNRAYVYTGFKLNK